MNILFTPSGHRFSSDPGETILQAGLRQGYQLSHACDNGVCYICKAELYRGRVSDESYLVRKTAGSNNSNEATSAEVLLCKTVPLTNCEFRFKPIWGPNELDTRKYPVQVVATEVLNEHIYRVILLAPAGSVPTFFAGQYLQLLIPGQEGAFFSIANAPDGRELELHIEVQPGHESAEAVIRYLQHEPVVNVLLPMGKCFLAEVPDAEVVLIAAGTGFTQIKSLAEYLAKHGATKPVSLYWGVRREQEMYARKLVEQWVEDNPRWQFTPVFADNLDNEWTGHHEELVKAVLSARHEWSDTQVFVSGSPTMVYTAMDALIPAGLPASQFHSDVLEYAPRS